MKKKIVLFLRKKIEGQNSMEELAYSLKSAIPEIEIIELPYYSTSLIGMLKNGLFARKYQGDINHIFSITEGYLSLFLSGRKIITVHDLFFNSLSFLGKIAANLLWLLLPTLFTNIYTCISYNTRNQLLQQLPWIQKKIHVIYNPIKDDFFTDYVDQENSKPTILHIGTALHKNLSNVIVALKDYACKLIIIGKLFPEQLNLLHQYNIDFCNLCDISTSSVIKQYQEADIVSFPSSQEGFGMILAEANAIGKPIVAGNIDVLKEIGGEAALYVNPKSVNEIRNAIINLINNKELRDSLIKKGHGNATKFKLSFIANEYKAIYTSNK